MPKKAPLFTTQESFPTTTSRMKNEVLNATKHQPSQVGRYKEGGREGGGGNSQKEYYYVMRDLSVYVMRS